MGVLLDSVSVRVIGLSVELACAIDFERCGGKGGGGVVCFSFLWGSEGVGAGGMDGEQGGGRRRGGLFVVCSAGE